MGAKELVAPRQLARWCTCKSVSHAMTVAKPNRPYDAPASCSVARRVWCPDSSHSCRMCGTRCTAPCVSTRAVWARRLMGVCHAANAANPGNVNSVMPDAGVCSASVSFLHRVAIRHEHRQVQSTHQAKMVGSALYATPVTVLMRLVMVDSCSHDAVGKTFAE